LWTIDRSVIVHQSIQASLANTWNLEWFDSVNTGDGGAGVLLDDVQHGGAVIPASIWRDIVLPDIAKIRSSLDTQTVLDSKQSRQQNYTLQLGGLRPYLSCEVIADEYYVSTRVHWDNTSDYDFHSVEVKARPPLPLGCQHADHAHASNKSSYEFSYDRDVGPAAYGEDLETVTVAEIFDLHLRPEDSMSDSTSTDNDLPAGCPSFVALIVRMRNYTLSDQDVTALLCSQMIQQVLVNVTYSGSNPDEPTISVGKSPVLIEGPPTNLTNGTEGIDTFPYRVEGYLDGNLTSIEHNPPAIPDQLDRFMEHVIWGPNGTAADALIGRENRHVFKEAVQDLYAQYMRLVVDMRFRQPISRDEHVNGSTIGSMVMGTSEAFTSRLQLDRASKLALQIMLGAITLFGALALAMTDLRGTLPRKPTSIASRMALLAGSDLCREHSGDHPSDSGAEGWLFSLGWWRVSDLHNESTGRALSADIAAFGKEEDVLRGKRFGIDIGVPEQLGFRETKWWTLRRRLGTRLSHKED
jgi:hypothetical protein